jgi:N-acetylneuraminic acid mutarotase
MAAGGLMAADATSSTRSPAPDATEVLYTRSKAVSTRTRALGMAAIERYRHVQRTGDATGFDQRYPYQVWRVRAIDVVRKTRCLAHRYGVRIDDAVLTRELERICASTRSPEHLRGIFSVLGNDPVLIKECLVRPLLADRLLRTQLSWDQRLQGATRAEAADLARRLTASSFPADDRTVRVLRFRLASDGIGPAADSDALQLDRATYDDERQGFGPLGSISGPHETLDELRLDLVHEEDATSFEVLQLVVPKVLAEHWWQAHHEQFRGRLASRLLARTGPLPIIGQGAKAAGSWWERATPPPRFPGMTAVWTGSEMIVWGGGDLPLTDELAKSNLGASYDPVLDSWTGITTDGAPSPRGWHAAVWTGSEMLIWGGEGQGNVYYNDGGSYDPVTCTWRAISGAEAPDGRAMFFVPWVWTGSEMIIWGGVVYDSEGEEVLLDDGWRYNPEHDRWLPVSRQGAPSARRAHSAVWTGTEMIIWGGLGPDYYYGNGARYHPASNTWQPIPAGIETEARAFHAAGWTGTEMVVWGGWTSGFNELSSGGRYDPRTGRWRATSMDGAPAGGADPKAVWTGSELLIWCNTGDGQIGGRYNPMSDRWYPISREGAPEPRPEPLMVWTGSEMIVWGGFRSWCRDRLSGGGRYDPQRDSWLPISNEDAPYGNLSHSAVWTGNELIVWGGRPGLGTGAHYDLITDSWSPVAESGAPSPRFSHSAVWTGSEMIVWGGRAGAWCGSTVPFADGGRYDPVLRRWQEIPAGPHLAARSNHSAVWTGSEMIVWGGFGTATCFADGARYDPVSETWSAVTTSGAPSLSYCNRPSYDATHLAFWTGQEMLVLDGNDHAGYEPSSNTWTGLPWAGRPYIETSVSVGRWTGDQLLIWSSDGWQDDLWPVWSYTPGETWVETQAAGAPRTRAYSEAIWTGSELIVWGGYWEEWNPVYVPHDTNTGGLYDPSTQQWRATTTEGAPAPRYHHTMVWTGNEMIVWGGFRGTSLAIYTPG